MTIAQLVLIGVGNFEKAASAEAPGTGLSDFLSQANSSYAPLSNLGGAATGAVPGMAVGGVLGLLRAALGGGGYIKNTLGGAALGGLTGAGLGLGGAALARRGITKRILAGYDGADNTPEERENAEVATDAILRRLHTQPGDIPKYLWDRFVRRDEDAGADFARSIQKNTGREALITGGASILPFIRQGNN